MAICHCLNEKKIDDPSCSNSGNTPQFEGSSMMTLEQISRLGRKLATFLLMFSRCFKRGEGAALLHVYVRGLLSNIQRKNCEAIALRFRTAPRTLQRFLESIKWDEKRLRDTCQKIIARDHAHPQAIGTIDETGNTKSGNETAGVGRQYNGNKGKIDNCVVGVHLGYMAPGFRTLIDSQMYLKQEFIDDAARRKKTTFRTR
jgi:SRSO17 transposase